MLCGGILHAQQLPGDSLAADFRCLVKYLDQTHPDSYTGFKGSISNSAQMFLPADDPSTKIFWSDIMLSSDDYRKYGFDKHAYLL